MTSPSDGTDIQPGRASTRADVAVIGAGPAGLAAACTAADAGLAVTVLDLGERIGGQYFRHAAEQARSDDGGPYHHGWERFVRWRERFDRHIAAGVITYLPAHSVWSVNHDVGGGHFHVRATAGERDRLPRTVTAVSVIIATGAHDRQIPFPGWTLPGVMSGGGVQALLKGSGVAAGRRTVVAGTGPFLLAVTDGLLAAGVDVVEVLEANAPWELARHPRALPGLATKLGEAAGYARTLRAHRVPLRARHAVVAAHGSGSVQSVTVARIDVDWKVVSGTERELACDLLAVGYGFTPQVELALAAGAVHAIGHDGSVIIRADRDGRTSVPGLYAAGETTGIGGADLAEIEGLICGAAVVRDLAALRGAAAVSSDGSLLASPNAGQARSLERLRRKRRILRHSAAALHAAHPLQPGWRSWLSDDTEICRCEEVPYARVREALEELGAVDARAVKLLARPGMGWCQGRICGSAVAALTAEHCGREVSAEDLVAMARRTIATPVPLAHLAELGDGDPAPEAGTTAGDGDGPRRPAPDG